MLYCRVRRAGCQRCTVGAASRERPMALEPAKELLKEFWRLEKAAEKMMEGLGK